MSDASTLAAAAVPRDPLYARSLKVALYGCALALYLVPISSVVGIAAAVLGGAIGFGLAGAAARLRLRLAAALPLAALGIVLCFLLGQGLLERPLFAELLGIKAALATAEVVTFGLAALLTVFLLRSLSLASRSLSLLEVIFVSGSVAVMLADHRNRMLNRPRFFSDWAWALGVDPGTVLVAIGIVASVASVFLFLRGQRLLKIATTLLLLAGIGVAFFLLGDPRVRSETPEDALGLTGKKGGSGKDGKEGKGGGGGSGGGEGKKGEGKGQGGGGSSSDNPFKDDYDSSGTPNPVAIAILRDDFESKEEVLYFRQLALSQYNGHHLVDGSRAGWDRDVITEFPRPGASVLAEETQSPGDHVVLPTTMYLLVDHPQPLGLTHSRRVSLAKNPNPQQFVVAYDVESLVLTVPTQRLLGRVSMPEGWPAAKRAHYTALPEDPRYQTLSDIIVRDVDPRFEGDDLAKAYAIKRYLEKEGFYTKKTTHASTADPTASFLFGSLRGYCVHFAHAAVYLFRSQGIAARVAIGYAVQTVKRSGGSSILIMADRAHAWPEVHIAGIGWVTFDIYPERTDMPPPTPVDYDLEKLLGELARNDKTAGLRPDAKPIEIPWGALGRGAGLLLAGLLLAGYLVKTTRRLAPSLRGARAYPRLAYRAVLDSLSDLGEPRRRGETRERHASRLASLAPHLSELTTLHLGAALGAGPADPARARSLVDEVRREVRRNAHPARRALALLNPVGWMFTR
jgi:protein-glutamine gamma-glutamyltransferase